MAASATGVRFSTAVNSLASARRSPATAASASVAARVAASETTSVARSGVGAKELRHLRDGRAGPEHLGDPGLAERGDVVVGDDPADRDEDVGHAPFVEELR